MRFGVRISRAGSRSTESVIENPESAVWAVKPRNRGFTLLELMTAILIISALAAVLLDRLAYYQEAAEKAAMESTVRLIKTGLQIQLAELIIANREGDAQRLEAEDPTRWLDPRPANYGGDYREPPAAGTWYYDVSARQLVYVVNTGSRLKLDSTEGRKEVRFRAQLLKAPLQVPGGQVERINGVALIPVSPYRWP